MANTVGSSSASSTVTDMYGHKRYTMKQNMKSLDFDPAEYAKAMGDIKRDQAARLEEKYIEPNLKKMDALRELKANTTQTQTVAQSLSDNLNIIGKETNLWNQRYPTTINATGQDYSSTVRVTATASSPLQNFKINIQQRASSDVMPSTQSIPNGEAGLTISGTLVINGISVPITDGTGGSQNMSLLDIRDAVNRALGDSGESVTMTLVSQDGVSPTQNLLWQLSDSKLSRPIDLTGTDLTVLDGLFVPRDPQNAQAPRLTPQQSLDLLFSYNGLSLTRSGSNVISDLIVGTTIEVNGAQTGDLYCGIDRDRLIVQSGIANFVEQYNTLQKFISDQMAIDPKTRQPKDDAYLYNSSIVRSILGEFDGILSSSVTLFDGRVRTLKDIGITVGGSLDTKNNQDIVDTKGLSRALSLDADILNQVMNGDDIDIALALLGDMATSTHSAFTVFAIPSAMESYTIKSDTPITMTVERDNNGNIVGTFSAIIETKDANGNVTSSTPVSTTAILKDGYLFTSPDQDPDNPQSTPFDGLRVGVLQDQLDALQNGQSISSTLRVSEGLLTRLSNVVSKYTDFHEGQIDQTVDSLEKTNEQFQLKVDRLNELAIKEEERFIQRFTRVREIEAKWQSLLNAMESYLKMLTRST